MVFVLKLSGLIENNAAGVQTKRVLAIIALK